MKEIITEAEDVPLESAKKDKVNHESDRLEVMDSSRSDQPH